MLALIQEKRPHRQPGQSWHRLFFEPTQSRISLELLRLDPRLEQKASKLESFPTKAGSPLLMLRLLALLKLERLLLQNFL